MLQNKLFNVNRLILKPDDILLVSVPDKYFNRKDIVRSLYEQIKKQILPRPNKILVLPESIDISVIGETKVEEYISHVDLWNLFDEEEEDDAG
jgi:hypothetical protein